MVMSYGSLEGVAKFIADVINEGRVFTDTTTPTSAIVEQMLEGVSSEVNVELLQNGYVAPVTEEPNPIVYTYLVYAVNAGAAARTLSTLPHQAYSLPDAESPGGDRRTMLDRELVHCINRIRRQEFPADRDASFIRNVFSGSALDPETGVKRKALFTRNQFSDRRGDRRGYLDGV